MEDVLKFLASKNFITETDGGGIWIAFLDGDREVWAGGTSREQAIGRLGLRLYVENCNESSAVDEGDCPRDERQEEVM